MKILFCGNTSSSVINFRKDLITELKNKGHNICVLCSDSIYEKEILELGVRIIITPFDNRSVNPFTFHKIKRNYLKIIKAENPDIVFTFQLKPNLFATTAAKTCKVKRIVALNEGRGDAFGGRGLVGLIKEKIAIVMHKKAFKNIDCLIVLNETDFSYFLKNKIVTSKQIYKIPGVGVDSTSFGFEEQISEKKNVIMISRLILNKGIFEFCEIAKKVREKRMDIRFILIGPEQEIGRKDLAKFTENGIIDYVGPTKDVKPYFKDCRFLVLPSFYKEGFGIVLAEAMSMGRCPIAYHNCGPDEVIDNGVNGFLVEQHNINGVVDLIIKNIDNIELLATLGKNGREKVLAKFDKSIINKKFIEKILS